MSSPKPLREKGITIKLTETELEAIRTKAEEYGFGTMASFIRYATFYFINSQEY